jgi:hypothetical protein
VKLDKDFPQEKRSDVPSKPTSRLPSFEEKKVVAEPIPAAAKTSIEEAVAAPAPIVAAPVVSSADPVIPAIPSPPSTLETQKALVKANLRSALQENATWSANHASQLDSCSYSCRAIISSSWFRRWQKYVAYNDILDHQRSQEVPLLSPSLPPLSLTRAAGDRLLLPRPHRER